MKKRFAGGITLVIVIIAVIAAGILLSFSSQFFYFFEKIDEQEIGIQFESGSIKNVVGPGVYSATGLFVEIKRISSHAVTFSVTDQEIITRDKQRIGLVVSGDIFRPGVNDKDVIRKLWAQYKDFYLNDELTRTRVSDLAKQAMKVCVGDRPFDDNIIGTARDELRSCIDEEISGLAANFGLQIENVVVPEVLLSPEVQTALDAIVQSRLETEKAAQDKLRANAQADAERAKQEGEIRVAQSRLQEETKQQTTLATLEQEKILAQKAVIEANLSNELARVEANQAIIEAEKANELLSAQKDLEINKALAAAATEKAKADMAAQLILAQIFTDNPSYLQLQLAQTNASAFSQNDKIIFTPEGVIPNLVIPGPGIVPTVNAQGTATTTIGQ